MNLTFAKNRPMTHPWKFLSRLSVFTLACGLGALAGCGAPEEAAQQESPVVTTRVQQPLNLLGAKWPGGQVPVCWDSATMQRADFATRSVQVRDLANNSWPTVANVEFTGWGPCPWNTAGMVVVRLNDSIYADAGGIGYSAVTPRIMNLGVNRGDFAGGLIPHEFGHILGFSHEMARPDFEDDTSGSCHEMNYPGGNTLFTPADRGSIMASTGYCQQNASLSPWDIMGVQNAYGRRTFAFAQLLSTYSDGRSDHATVANGQTRQDVQDASYRYAYADGWVYTQPAESTVALKLYYHDARQDHLSLSSTSTEADALAQGYRYVRDEGYIYPTQQPGTVALRLFWHPTREDYFSTATSDGAQAALNAGYSLVRIEGYVFQNVPYALGWVYWQPHREDNLLTAQNSQLARDAGAAQYQFAGFDGLLLKYNVSGTQAVRNYWSWPRSDHFALATLASAQEALNAGYSPAGTHPPEGFVFTWPVTGSIPLHSFVNDARRDYFTTSSRQGVAYGNGYTLRRTEGYTYSIVD
jgi:hypothetical protein